MTTDTNTTELAYPRTAVALAVYDAIDAEFDRAVDDEIDPITDEMANEFFARLAAANEELVRVWAGEAETRVGKVTADNIRQCGLQACGVGLDWSMVRNVAKLTIKDLEK